MVTLQQAGIIGYIYTIVGLITLLMLVFEIGKNKSWDIANLPISHKLVLLSRVMIGVLFILSGFIKANDYIGFSYKLEEYFEVFAQDIPALEGFFMGMMKPLSLFLAWFLSILEIAMGVAIIVGYRMKLTVWSMLLLMIFFTFLTWYSWTYNKVTDCGCFGDALKLKPLGSFKKDLMLLLMLIPVALVMKSIKPLKSNSFSGGLSLAAFILSGVFAYACYQYLPLIDFRAYKVGVSLPKCTTESEPGEAPKCKDYDEGYRINLAGNDTIVDASVKVGERDSVTKYHVLQRVGKETETIDEMKGAVLMVIMYNMEKAPAEAVAQSVELYKQLDGSGIKVLGMTGTGKSDMIEKYIPDYKIPYQMSIRDMTMLKTIVRSNPGYMLLKDGVVMKKWHYHLTPTVGELKALVR